NNEPSKNVGEAPWSTQRSTQHVLPKRFCGSQIVPKDLQTDDIEEHENVTNDYRAMRRQEMPLRLLFWFNKISINQDRIKDGPANPDKNQDGADVRSQLVQVRKRLP